MSYPVPCPGPGRPVPGPRSAYTDLLSADRKKIQTTLGREWKGRWEREGDRSRARHRGRAEEPADEPPPKERLKLHDELQKAESSLLVQMRTGKIGLRAFLFERRVPDVMTPVCSCGDGRWPGDS